MDRFWDTSAIVPLLIEETHSRSARALSRADSRKIVWQFTETEAVSALTKHARGEHPMTEDELDGALERLDVLATRWTVVQALDSEALDDMRASARALMRRHPLVSGDALQLAAALDYFDPPKGYGFVVVDGTLARAAAAEGFNV